MVDIKLCLRMTPLGNPLFARQFNFNTIQIVGPWGWGGGRGLQGIQDQLRHKLTCDKMITMTLYILLISKGCSIILAKKALIRQVIQGPGQPFLLACFVLYVQLSVCVLMYIHTCFSLYTCVYGNLISNGKYFANVRETFQNKSCI